MKKLVRESLNEKIFGKRPDPIKPFLDAAEDANLFSDDNSDESSPLEKLHQTFANEEFDVDELDEDGNGFWVENENGVRAFITPAGDDFYFDILVQGMNEDVPITDIQFHDVIDIFGQLDEEWLIENDPKGDQY